MSDITAAEYRTAEKVARSLGFVTAQSYADHAARLESVGVTLDAQLAQTLRQVASPSFADRADYWGTLAAAALKFLTSTDRLIPAGGRGLEFSEVEALRSAWEELKGYRVDGHARPYVNQMVKVVGALFPATEPAEDAKPCGSNSVTLGWCKLTARHEGLHTNGTYLWGTPSEPDPPAPSEPAEERCQSVSIFRERCALVPGHDGRHAANGCAWGYPPAPAESAEEETKAEDESVWHWVQSAGGYYSGPACTGGYGCRSMAHYEGCLRPSLTASAPVVPAPTETGPEGTAAELREFAQNLITDIENRAPWTADQIAEHIEENFQ